jgi:hypothetical protein
MNPRITELLDRLGQIEEEIEQELRRRRAELHVDFEHRRIVFEREVLEPATSACPGQLKPIGSRRVECLRRHTF